MINNLLIVCCFSQTNFRNGALIYRGCVERWCALLEEADWKYGFNLPMAILGAIRLLLYSAPWSPFQKGGTENISHPYHLVYQLRVIPSQLEY